MKTSLTITFLTILFFTAGHCVFGQSKTLIYTNATNAYYNKAADFKNLFYASKINIITLNGDSTYEFMSQPHTSCFTWRQYKGTWRRNNDTLLFFDHYEVMENDTKATYKKDSRQDFVITFKTDKNAELKNRSIKIQYEYDYDAHLEEPEKIVELNEGNTLVIPFRDVPYLSDLASIRIEYLLEFKDKRYSYLTPNNTVNKKESELPNIISVEFVEKPRKEIVYRTIKCVIQKDNLIIVSTTKSKINLPDYHRDIEFETSYGLSK